MRHQGHTKCSVKTIQEELNIVSIQSLHTRKNLDSAPIGPSGPVGALFFSLSLCVAYGKAITYLVYIIIILVIGGLI